MTHTLIHEFNIFSISRTIGGDYVAELDNGKEVLLISPNGSAEHNLTIQWIETPYRTENEFFAACPEITQGLR